MWSSLTLTLVATLAAANNGPGQLAGKVVDAQGKPVADALVVLAKGPADFHALREPARAARTAEQDTLGIAQTDETGSFAIAFDRAALNDWPRPALAVWAYRDGFSLDVRRLDPDSPDAMPLTKLVLNADAPATELRVVQSNGQPAAAARVTPEWVRGFLLPADLAERLRQTSDDQGAVSIAGVKRDDLKTVRVVSATSGIQWLAMPWTHAGKSVELSLAAVGQIAGQLTSDDGRPVPHVTVPRVMVRLSSACDPGDDRSGGGIAEAVCDDEGRFQVAAIAAGALSISVESLDEPICLSPNEQPRRLLPGKNDLRLSLTKPIRIEGSVLDGEQPVAGAGVLLSSAAGSSRVFTGADGKFVGYALPGVLSMRPVWLPAPYYCPYHHAAEHIITENDGDIVRTSPLAATRGAVFHGRVVDGAGQPIARAEVLGVWIREDGMALDDRPAGQMRAAPRRARLAVGGRTAAAPRAGKPAGANGFRLRQVQPAAPAAAGVREGSQSRVGGPSSRPVHAWTNEDGQFTIDYLANGAELRLWAVTGNATTSAPLVEKTGDAAHLIVIGPDDGVSLDGRVVDEGGHGVLDAMATIAVHVATPDHGGHSTAMLECFSAENLRTDADGGFATSQMLPADLGYSFAVEAPGFFSVKTEIVEPLNWQTATVADIVLTREPALRSLFGRVVGRQGQAIAGATVSQAGDGPLPTETTSAPDGSFTLPGVYDRPGVVLARADGFRLRGKRAGADQVGEIVLDRVGEQPPHGAWPPAQPRESMSVDERSALARVPFTGQKLVTIVAYNSMEAEGGIFLMEMGQFGGDANLDNLQQHMEEASNKQDQQVKRLTVLSTRDLNLEIRGQPATFKIQKAEDPQSKQQYLQVIGTFRGKQGPAILMGQLNAEEFNEEDAEKLARSIK